MKTIHNKNLALVAVATFGVALFAAGVQANETGVGADSRAVHYSDLDVNSAAGAKALYGRILRAAEQVCGDAYSRRLEEAAAAKACRNQAIVSSVRTVNSSQLTRTANAHGYAVEGSINVASAR